MKKLIILLTSFLMVTPALATSPYSSKILSIEPASLVGYWAMDEDSGVVALDTSGNNRHAYYFGTSVASEAAPDGAPAAKWDGINDQLQWDLSTTTGINAWNPDSGTISFWFKFPSYNAYANFLWLEGTTGYFQDFLSVDRDHGSDTLFVYFVRGGVGGNVSWYPSPAADVWHNITIVFDASSYTAYLDGTSGGSQALGAWAGGNLTNARIYPGDEMLIGRFALWNIPLTTDQVEMVSSWTGIPSTSITQYVLLPSGQSGAIEFSITAGDVLIAALLLLATTLVLFRTVIKR